VAKEVKSVRDLVFQFDISDSTYSRLISLLMLHVIRLNFVNENRTRLIRKRSVKLKLIKFCANTTNGKRKFVKRIVFCIISATRDTNTTCSVLFVLLF
jgi:hypothetical protein